MTMAPKVLLANNLKTLKLPTFLRKFDKLTRQRATEGLDHVLFLARLVELELIDREKRMVARRIKAAQFPAAKNLDSFDFNAIAKLNKMQVLELARRRWIDCRENVHRSRPERYGHDARCTGLGLAAYQKGLPVRLITAAMLFSEFMTAGNERRLLCLQK
ncbi:ATP-binding protein [Roseovarius nanhaiticus]|uniref:ATP-binding protein n=1 Tax=Roseovarius nanhaiticus TaxID=573024 RepID=UPI0024922882|nr:ATP-binding protein [Roseovarius nanhaiticus]